MYSEQTSVFLKEYYQITAPLLAYEPCGETVEAERNILRLLCEVRGSHALYDGCWRMIEEARCLQTSSDGELPFSTEMEPYSVAFDVKKEVLAAHKIKKPKKFDVQLFAEALKEDANVGKPASCKLLAFLNWLGILIPQNRTVARNIWSALAVYGDLLSVRMLAYTYEADGMEEAKTWTHVLDILYRERESFSAIALCSDYPAYDESEVQLANLIMFIKQMHAEKEDALLNRPMIHYVLHSSDDYRTKLTRVSERVNYYLAMYMEDLYANKEYGF